MSLGSFKGILHVCTARNNEEYRIVLKKRQRIMVALFLLGILTLGTVITVLILKPEILPSYHAGFFCGVGTGLILGGIISIWKIRRTMNNEAALKEARLAETDEREREITNKAIRMTAIILLLVLYLLLLICTFISIDTITLLYLLIALFLLSYIVSRKIYSRML